MADMIKFFRGLEASLPAAGASGALYITTDEGAIYLGTGTGMKRLGDFVQVANVEALPEKAHESCLYYCVAENILAKWNGTEWKQINKQPTAEELKGLLGLGSMAYKSEVAEGDLKADLAAKINTVVEGNHSHSNKGVIDGITAEKVAAWDASEGNAKGYADGLNTAMNTRVEALEAVDHEHANKALLDTYTQTEANLADAVAKKHEHANKAELDKIVDGDKAKWDAVAADHLTSADKTALENSIKEAKKAGTDANTALETYKVSNDARVLAVEEDIAEITDGTNGVLAQAKAYADGKDTAIAEAKAAGTTAQSNLEAYQTSNDAALAGVKATAEAAATKEYTDAELAKKADASTVSAMDTAYKAADSELSGRIKDLEDNKAGYATTGYVDGKASDAQAAAEATAAGALASAKSELEGKISDGDAAVDGKVTALAGRVSTAEGKITALEGASATHATKGELEAVDAKFADYNTTVAQKAIDDAQDARIKAIEDDYVVAADIADFETKENVKKVADDLAAYIESNDAAVADRYTKEEADGKFAVKGEDSYDDEEVRGLISDNADAIAAEKKRAEEAEAGLQGQIDLIMNNPDTKDVIDSIAEFTDYINTHGAIADGFRTDIDKNKEDIAANADAIADEADRAANAEGVLSGRLDVLEAIDHDAYVGADAALKAELQAEIDADVKALADGQVKTNTEAIAANAKAITDGDAATLAAAKEDAAAKVKELADGQVTTNKDDIASLFAQLQWGEF